MRFLLTLFVTLPLTCFALSALETPWPPPARPSAETLLAEADQNPTDSLRLADALHAMVDAAPVDFELETYLANLLPRCATLAALGRSDDASRIVRKIKWRLSSEGGYTPALVVMQDASLPLPPGTTDPITMSAWQLPVANTEGLYESVFHRQHLIPRTAAMRVVKPGEGPLNLPEPGLWWVEAEGRARRAGRLIHRPELFLVVAAGGPQEILAWVIDRDGKPCPGVEVAGTINLQETQRKPRGRWNTENGEEETSTQWDDDHLSRYHPMITPADDSDLNQYDTSILARRRVSGISDGLGLVHVPLQAPVGAPAATWRLVAFDGRRSGVSWGGTYLRAQPETWQAWINPARPVWLPGETLEVAVVVRGAQNGANLNPENATVTLQLQSPRYDKSIPVPDPVTVTCDAFGTTSATFALPRSIQPGKWTIEVQHASKTIATQQVLIEAFRTPPINLEVQTDASQYALGQSALLTVKARTFFGAPLATTGIFELCGFSVPFSTNRDGLAQLSLAPELIVGCSPRFWIPEIRVEDATHREVKTFVPLFVDRYAAGEIQIDPPPRWIAQGRELSLIVRGQRGGTPISEPEIVEIQRKEGKDWILVEKRQVELRTGAGLFRWQAPSPGQWKIKVRDNSHEVTVVGGDSNAKLQMRLEPEEPLPGSTSILHLSGPRDAACVVAIEDGAGQAELRTVTLDAVGAAAINIAIAPRHAPGLRIQAACLRENVLARTSLAVRTKDLGRELLPSITITPPPAPGGTSSIVVKVQDPSGNPVAAAVMLSAIDEAVYAIREDWFGDGRSNLAPVPRSADQHWKLFIPITAAKDAMNGLFHQTTAGDWVIAPRSRMGCGSGGGIGRYGGSKGSENIAPNNAPRKNIRYTAGFFPALKTDATGQCSTTIVWPDQLTTWRCTARTVDADRRTGMTVSKVESSRPLAIDLDLPRLLRQGDKVTIQALIMNRTGDERQIKTKIFVDGAAIENPEEQTLTTLDGNRAVATWTLIATKTEGLAKIRVEADDGADHRDNFELTIACHPAAAEVTEGIAGQLSDNSTLVLPAWAKTASATLNLSRGPAGTLDEALTWLAQYPYGCTEQTLSRFLPAAAILARTATAAVLDGRLPLQRRILTAQLPDMVASGLGRLKTLGDGRWGFWPGSRADLRLTAWVRFGCAELARRGLDTSAAGALPDALIDDATPALFSALLPKPQDADAAADARAIWADACRSDRSDDLDALLLLALADSLGQKPPTVLLQAAWQQRESLDAGRLAVLALALQAAGRGEDAKTVMIALNNLDASKAPAVATGWLGDPAVQAGALCLAALRIVPDLPLADRAAMWLMALRRQGNWGSTHATAWACLALGEHATLRPSTVGQVPWKLLADNKEVLAGTLTNDGETLTIPASALTAQKLTLVGKGLWYDLHLHGNADLPANSNGLHLTRNWSRIQRGDLGEEIVRPLTDGAITVGDQVEVELVLESPLDLEQVLVEVPLSAGISPVFSESGPAGWWGRVELRADRTAFIIDRLPAGRSVIRYRAAVQMAGTVHAPAATALAMYRVDLNARTAAEVLHINPAPLPASVAASTLRIDGELRGKIRRQIHDRFNTSTDDAQRLGLIRLGLRMGDDSMIPSDLNLWPATLERAEAEQWARLWLNYSHPATTPALRQLLQKFGVGEDRIDDLVTEKLCETKDVLADFATITHQQPVGIRRAVARHLPRMKWPDASERQKIQHILAGETEATVRLAILEQLFPLGGERFYGNYAQRLVDSQANSVQIAAAAQNLAHDSTAGVAWLELLSRTESAAERWRLARPLLFLRRACNSNDPNFELQTAAKAANRSIITALLKTLTTEITPRVRKTLLEAVATGFWTDCDDLLFTALPTLSQAEDRERLIKAVELQDHEYQVRVRTWFELEPDLQCRRELLKKIWKNNIGDAAWFARILKTERDLSVLKELLRVAGDQDDVLTTLAQAPTTLPQEALLAIVQRLPQRIDKDRLIQYLVTTATGGTLNNLLWNIPETTKDLSPAAWENLLTRLDQSSEDPCWPMNLPADGIPDQVVPFLQKRRENTKNPGMRLLCLRRLALAPVDPAWKTLPPTRLDAVILRVLAGGTPSADLRPWIENEQHGGLHTFAASFLAKHGDAADARWLLETQRSWLGEDVALLRPHLAAEERLQAALTGQQTDGVAQLLLGLPTNTAGAETIVKLLEKFTPEKTNQLKPFLKELATSIPETLWQAAETCRNPTLVRQRMLTLTGKLLVRFAAEESQTWKWYTNPWPSARERQTQLQTTARAQGKEFLQRALRDRSAARRQDTAAVWYQLLGERIVYENAAGALITWEP